MSDKHYDIKIDDLIVFFRRADKGGGNEEKIVNRLIPHETYSADELRIPKNKIDPAWRNAVVSDPPVKDDEKHHYYVANLSRLILPDQPEKKREKIVVPLPARAGESDLAGGDLVVFPFDDSESCFRVPREVYENECPELPESDVPDLEFMAGEEGVVIANVPKVTPQGCSCCLLSLVSLRSGMLHGEKDKRYSHKSDHAKAMPNAFKRGHQG